MSTKGVVADTHTIIWYVDSPRNLTGVATTALDDAADDAAQRIFISAISLIEMHYLTEKSRINAAVLPKVLAEIDAPQPLLEVIPIGGISFPALRRGTAHTKKSGNNSAPGTN